jgi:hypothetical protein
MKRNKYSVLANGLLVTVFLSVLLLFSHCNKDNNSYISYHKGVNASQQFVHGQQMMTQLLSTYLKSLTDSAFLASGVSRIDGANVQLSTDSVQKITIEYPYYGADDGYGHWRAGTYEALTTDDFFEKDAEIHFEFKEFSWDKDTLTVDSLVLHNLGKVDGSNEHYWFRSGDIRVDYELSDDVSIFKLDEYFKLIKDPSTDYTSEKDWYEIWGSFGGVTEMNFSYETQIVEDSALANMFTCSWLKEGPAIVNVTNFDYPSAVYFSPADSCENLYLVEINGNPFPEVIDD